MVEKSNLAFSSFYPLWAEMKNRLRDSVGILDPKIDRFGIDMSVVHLYSLWPVCACSSSIKYDQATSDRLKLRSDKSTLSFGGQANFISIHLFLGVHREFEERI